MQTLTDASCHQQAVRYAASLWLTQALEGRGDPAEVSFTSLIGQLPQEVNGSPVYVVYVQGTAESCFGESYPTEATVTVSLTENGEPNVRPATDREVEQAEQHCRSESGGDYGC